jgi:cytidine deaminase
LTDAPHPTSLDPALAARLVGALRDRAELDSSDRNCAAWAAVIDADGRVGVGHTIDSDSLGLGTCATRVALTRAVAEGLGTPSAIALAGTPSGAMLCGLCRQTLLELASAARVTRLTDEGLVDIAVNVTELLPDAFEEFRGS